MASCGKIVVNVDESALFNSTSSESAGSQNEGSEEESSPSEEISIPQLTASNFTKTFTDPRTFSLSLDFSGDTNNNSSAVIHLCSHTTYTACDPKGNNSISYNLDKDSNKLITNITSVPASFNPGDLIKYEFVISDPDGLTNNVFPTGYFQIPYDTKGTYGQIGILQQGSNSLTTGAEASEYIHSSVLDSDANLYLAGSSNGHFAEVNGGVFHPSGSILQDPIIIKYSSDGDKLWTKQLGALTIGEGAQNTDIAKVIRIDPRNGDLIIVGETGGDMFETSGGSNDIFAVRLDKNGNIKDTVQLGSVTANGINDSSGSESVYDAQVSSSGEIYITGSTNGDFGENGGGGTDLYVVKLDQNLDLSWVTLYGSSHGANTSSNDYGHKLIILENGQILVSGVTAGNFSSLSSGGNDLFQVTLSSLGVKLTSFQFGTNGQEEPGAILEDPVSNEIVTAFATTGNFAETNGGSYDVAVRKNPIDFSSNTFSIQLGSVTAPAPNSTGMEFIGSIAIDSSGNYFMLGFTTGSLGETNGGGGDLFIIKVSSAGALLNTYQFGSDTFGTKTLNNQYDAEIHLDQDNNIYVTGRSSDSDFAETAAGSDDAILVKLDSNFNVLWSRHLGAQSHGVGSGHMADNISGMKVDGDGNTYIAGSTRGIGDRSGKSASYTLVQKFNSDKQQLWSKSFGSDSFFKDLSVRAMDLDKDNNIIIVGDTYSDYFETVSSQDLIVIKVNGSNGNLIWEKQIGLTSLPLAQVSGGDSSSSVATDSSGNIIIGGSSTGSLGETNAGSADAVIMKLNPDGDIIWISQFGTTLEATDGLFDFSGTDYIEAVKVDSSDNIYFAGKTTGDLGQDNRNGGGQDIFYGKISAAGTFLWSKQVGAGLAGVNSSGTDTVKSIDIDNSSNIFIAGVTNGSLFETNAGGYDLFVFKTDSNGNRLWSTQLGQATGAALNDLTQTDWLYSIKSVDGATPYLYVVGSTNGSYSDTNSGQSDLSLIKVDSPTGGVIWAKSYGTETFGTNASRNDVAKEVDILPSGNLLVVGDTYGNLGEKTAGSYDIFMSEFDTSGNLQ